MDDRYLQPARSPGFPVMVMARGRIAPKDEDDLQASLAALSRLSTGRLNLEDLWVRVATSRCGRSRAPTAPV